MGPVVAANQARHRALAEPVHTDSGACPAMSIVRPPMDQMQIMCAEIVSRAVKAVPIRELDQLGVWVVLKLLVQVPWHAAELVHGPAVVGVFIGFKALVVTTKDHVPVRISGDVGEIQLLRLSKVAIPQVNLSPIVAFVSVKASVPIKGFELLQLLVEPELLVVGVLVAPCGYATSSIFVVRARYTLAMRGVKHVRVWVEAEPLVAALMVTVPDIYWFSFVLDVGVQAHVVTVSKPKAACWVRMDVNKCPLLVPASVAVPKISCATVGAFPRIQTTPMERLEPFLPWTVPKLLIFVVFIACNKMTMTTVPILITVDTFVGILEFQKLRVGIIDKQLVTILVVAIPHSGSEPLFGVLSI